MADRFQIRRTTTKATPETTDLLDGELAYSFNSGNLFIKNPVTGLVDTIAGKTQVDSLATVNKPPQGGNSNQGSQDNASQVNGNAISQFGMFDPDGDTIAVTNLSYGASSKTLGSLFTTTYGSMNMTSTGTYTFFLSNAARALNAGQSATELFTVTMSDGKGSFVSKILSIEIFGTNQAPMALATSGVMAFNATYNGNVLSGVTDPEGQIVSLVSFSVLGETGPFNFNQQVLVQGVGSITVLSTGEITFVPLDGYSGSVPTLSYVVSDGTNNSNGSLTLVVSPPQVAPNSNPVTYAMTGSRRTFHVGPGQTMTHPDEVPWASLTAGDIVNIYHRSTPYVAKFGICGQGTASNPIIVNGVTDASGNRPIIDGSGARTPNTMMDPGGFEMFNVGSDAVGSERLGTIILRKPLNAPSPDYKPCWIQIRNLNVTGAGENSNYTSIAGNVRPYIFSGGVMGVGVDDVLVENCVLYGNFMGIYTNLIGKTEEARCERWTIRSNRVFGNGKIASDTEHNMYLQGYKFITEFNYIGQVKAGSGGSSSKHRVGSEIIRYNWIETSARALDLVEPEEQRENDADGNLIPWDYTRPDYLPNLPDYGIDHVYGNIIINDTDLPMAGRRPIHYGADNAGQQEGGGASFPIFVPGPTHRKKMYFFNNTMLINVLDAGGTVFTNYVFQISAKDIVVEVWNCIFYIVCNVETRWTQFSGTINFRGNNLLYRSGGAMGNQEPGAPTGAVVINNLGTTIQNNPLFANPLASSRDLSLSETSPALSLGGAAPSGMDSYAYMYSSDFQPKRGANGGSARPVIGAGSDLGAVEYDPSAPPDAAPGNVILPSIQSIGIIGDTLSVTPGSWLRMAAGSLSYQWQINTGGVWTDIPGAVNSTWVADRSGDIRALEIATNIIGTTSASSDLCVVTATAIVAPIVSQSRASANLSRDIAGTVGVAAAMNAPTTNFLIFTTDSQTTPVTNPSMLWQNDSIGSRVSLVGTVKCGTDKWLLVWKALNIPSTVGSALETIAYPANSFALAVTLEIPGDIVVGTPSFAPEIIGAEVQSSNLTVGTDALLVCASVTKLSSSGSYTWSNGFAELTSLPNSTDPTTPRVNISTGQRRVGPGTYSGRVALTSGIQTTSSSGLVLVPITFV